MSSYFCFFALGSGTASALSNSESCSENSSEVNTVHIAIPHLRSTFEENNASREMAHRCRTNKGLASQTRLPRIRKKCDIAQNPTFLDSKEDSSPLSFLRLPQIENRLTEKSKTTLSLQETQSFNLCEIATIDKKYPPVRRAAEHRITTSTDRMKDSKEVNMNEETYTRSSAYTIESNRLDSQPTKSGMVKGKTSADNVFRRPIRLLRRRLKPCQAYQGSDGQISHGELLTLDQKMDQLRACTERDNMTEVKDFNGKRIDLNKTGDSDITSYIAMFEVERRANVTNSDYKNKLFKCVATEERCSDEETNVRVRGRFYEALDNHFFHHYRNTHPERRMAICEEIERTIVVNDLALTCFREHLSLQDVMNTWML